MCCHPIHLYHNLISGAARLLFRMGYSSPSSLFVPFTSFSHPLSFSPSSLHSHYPSPSLRYYALNPAMGSVIALQAPLAGFWSWERLGYSNSANALSPFHVHRCAINVCVWRWVLLWVYDYGSNLASFRWGPGPSGLAAPLHVMQQLSTSLPRLIFHPSHPPHIELSLCAEAGIGCF